MQGTQWPMFLSLSGQPAPQLYHLGPKSDCGHVASSPVASLGPAKPGGTVRVESNPAAFPHCLQWWSGGWQCCSCHHHQPAWGLQTWTQQKTPAWTVCVWWMQLLTCLSGHSTTPWQFHPLGHSYNKANLSCNPRSVAEPVKILIQVLKS